MRWLLAESWVHIGPTAKSSHCSIWYTTLYKTNIQSKTHKEKFSSMKQRFLSRPFHSWTPTIPKMKKTKKQSKSTLPSMGSVSSSRVTRMRMPVWRDKDNVKYLLWEWCTVTLYNIYYVTSPFLDKLMISDESTSEHFIIGKAKNGNCYYFLWYRLIGAGIHLNTRLVENGDPMVFQKVWSQYIWSERNLYAVHT